jgi:putative transcriptional regulator
VTAKILRVPDASVKEVREKFHLTQAEFATRFGLELDTVRNWEQGRNKLDPPTRLLLKLIERCPGVVEDVLCDDHHS